MLFAQEFLGALCVLGGEKAMKTALYSALVLLTLAAAAAVLVVTYDLHEDLAAMRQVLVQASAATGDLDRTIQKVDTATGTLDGAAREERKNWEATSTEAAATGRALRLLISRIDRSFVDGTLLHFNAETLPSIDRQIAANGDEFQATLQKLGGSADGLTAVETRLNLRLGDPEIQELLGHGNAAAANLEAISANSAAMSGDMKLAVHRMAAPPSKFHEFLQAAWTTAKFGSLFIP